MPLKSKIGLNPLLPPKNMCICAIEINFLLIIFFGTQSVIKLTVFLQTVHIRM